MKKLSLNKKILRIWAFWPEGIKYHDHHLSDAMHQDGVKTLFACPIYAGKDYKSYSHNKDYSYDIFPMKFFSILDKPIPYNFLGFIKSINKFKPDTVHIYGLSNFTTYFTLFCLNLSSYDGEIFFNDHSDPTEKKSGFIAKIYYQLFKFLYKIFLNNKYKIVVPDDGSKSELITRYGSHINKSIIKIPLGFDSKVFNISKDNRSKDLPLRIGFAGKISSPKKIEKLLSAAQKFKKDEVIFYVAGFANPPTDYQKNLINKIKEKNIDNIVIMDFINKASLLADYYGKLDVAIFPGSISITTFEANGAGCPIILYESILGLEHRISSGRAYLFRTDQEMIKKIKHFINLKNETGINHEELSKAAIPFSWESIKMEYYSLYKWYVS